MLTQSKRDGHDTPTGPFRGEADGKIVKWISSQSVPAPLPPGFAGSTRSELFKLLEAGHYDVRLSREKYEKLACWIDLSVPFCGDYTEANVWTRHEMEKYQRYDTKRKLMDQMERDVMQALGGSKAR